MTRLCFLCSDVQMARRVVAVLQRARVGDSRLKVVGRHEAQLDDLPAAGIDRTDAIPGLARGLAAGGVVGMFGGVATLSFGGLGFGLGGVAIPMFGLAGAALSGLAGFLVGASTLSSRLKRFEHSIEHDGKILLMIAVRRERGGELEEFITDQVPGIECAGFEPRAPLIP